MESRFHDVLNSTGPIVWTGYSSVMSQMLATPAYTETSEERWNAWLARGAARERATRRRLFFVAVFLLFFAVIAAGVWFQ